mmetsp:Transcript_14812/g.22304  ORF Transcript_14812/g.22304 Transcript_14812/m.22304 type:complete len:605 (+) Transcript_14812:24-1838(+)
MLEEYLSWDPNDETKASLRALSDAGDTNTLSTLLSTRLEFGTAGLRGPMGPGYCRMNDLVTMQTMQGILRYLDRMIGEEAKEMGVVIGYDHRQAGSLSSRGFARMCASVAIAANYKVKALEGYVPTPFVPYAVTQLHAAVGIMITASHNPKLDNGIKVYWSNGSQIIPPHDAGIAASIDANLKPWQKYVTTDSYVFSNPLFVDVTDDIASTYYSSIQRLSSGPTSARMPLKIAYTAMHGVGAKWIERAFSVMNSVNCLPGVIPVPVQEQPDADFPTVHFPNPEEKGALDEAMAYASANNCTLIIANDPDADRLAVAERKEFLSQSGNAKDDWRVFTGNEIGVMLGHYQIQKYKSISSGDSKAAVVSTVVSSQMLKTIAEAEGVHFSATLTGFKWIGNESLRLQKEGYNVLFSYEEALGYCVGDVVCDKDGISAAVVLAELANSVVAQGFNMQQYLGQLQSKYGMYVSFNTYLLCYDKNVTERIFSRLRGGNDNNSSGEKNYWSKTGDSCVVSVKDITMGYDSTTPDGISVLPRTPDSHMIMFEFDNRCSIILRTSGTEPKIKCYSEMVGNSGASADEARETLACFVEMCIQEMLQPDVNGLHRP